MVDLADINQLSHELTHVPRDILSQIAKGACPGVNCRTCLNAASHLSTSRLLDRRDEVDRKRVPPLAVAIHRCGHGEFANRGSADAPPAVAGRRKVGDVGQEVGFRSLGNAPYAPKSWVDN